MNIVKTQNTAKFGMMFSKFLGTDF